MSLADDILSFLPYSPNERQKLLIMSLATATLSAPPRFVYQLRGYAGTGKTSLTGAYVRALTRAGIKHCLLAPTGRAAKVFADFSGEHASTIHKRIFRFDPMRPEKGFVPVRNKDRDMIFIVDEASMIGDDGSSASLLSHLVSHVFSSPGCRLMLIGDTAQLPPVGETGSPAMDKAYMEAFGLNVAYFDLTDPVRQVRDSGILYNATLVRRLLEKGASGFKGLLASRFPDVTVVDPRELEDYLTTSWARTGEDQTVVITRSNWRANRINADIRSRILYAEEPLQRGERLIITKNNYFFADSSEENAAGFLANGEMATVDWTSAPEEKYGLRFVDAEIRLSGSGNIASVKLLLDSLECDGPRLEPERMMRLQNLVIDSMPGNMSQKISAARKDPYFNAVQVKYAYCVTCHKAQGGQWKDVYIDLAGIAPEAFGEDFLRWLYTAITRASQHLFLINPTFMIK